MPPASLPRLPRPAGAPDHLTRLRARAALLLDAEERAAGIPPAPQAPSSRRSLLRRFGILLAGAVPAVGALIKAQAAFAASPGERTCAPQYGAPSWPAPRTPYVPVPTGKVTSSREELGKAKIWGAATALVATTKGRSDWNGFRSVEAKSGYYNDPWGGGTHLLLAVADPDSDFAYILRGASFYAVVDSDMYACTIGPGVLSIHPSLFKRKGAGDGLAGVIADFARVSDQQAYGKDSEGSDINLEEGVPQQFWIQNTNVGWQLTNVAVANVQRTGDIVQLDLRSSGSGLVASYSVDLKARKLVTTQLKGREWKP